MPLKDHLLPGEEVVARTDESSWVWLATTDRVIKYQSLGRREELRDLNYDQIIGVNLSSETKSGNELLGIIIMTVSVALFFVSEWVSVTVFILGFLILVRSSSSEESEFQLKTHQGTPEEWRLENAESDENREFIRALRAEINRYQRPREGVVVEQTGPIEDPTGSRRR